MHEREQARKAKRIYLALGLSSLVVVGAGLNIAETGKNPLAASLPDFGQWVSGVAGALAFIWLIASYFQQGEELELQRNELAATREQLALQKVEMARLADEAEKQATSIVATEQHARRDTYMRLFEVGQAIQATLLRSLDASLLSSRSTEIGKSTGRDFYITFSGLLVAYFLSKPRRHIAIVNDQLVISIWRILPNTYPETYGWHEYSCSLAEITQLLWFDEMLVKEAKLADRNGALVSFVQALPAQSSISKLKQLLGEVTEEPRQDKP